MRSIALICVLVALAACSENATDPIPPGNHGGDAAEPPEPRVITIDLPTDPCPTLTPCGGDPVGTWHLTGVCVEQAEVLADLYAWCPNLAFDGFTEQNAQGMFLFDSTSVYRELVAVITAAVRVPTSCSACDCDAVELELTDDEVTATCEPDCNIDSECVCSLRSRLVVRGLAGYDIDGTSFGALSSTYDYCIEGDTLTYVDTSDPVGEPGVYTLARQ